MTTASRVRLRLVGDERLVASVRRGDAAAFEALYDRHAAELLAFCVYMLGSRHDGEDAVQATFAAAYRTLRADRRSVALRPWLFAIARNNCLSILRRRHPWVELNGEPALDGDPLRELELREEVRSMVAGLRTLPESQRASLVLAELHGFSQAEIGEVLGVPAQQVKSFICQARSNLLSERTARETDCREIREELTTARGAALLRGRLRRHLRSCDDCRTYADGVARQRRHLGALMPLVPSLILKYRALEGAFGTGVVAEPAGYAGGTVAGGAVAGTAAEVAGGGFKALALKIAAGVAFLGTGAGTGATVLMAPSTPALTQSVSAVSSSSSASALPSASARTDARTGRTTPVAPEHPAAAAQGSNARGQGRYAQPQTPAKPTGRAGPGLIALTKGHRREERELLAQERKLDGEAQRGQEREQRAPQARAKVPAEPQHVHPERPARREGRTAEAEQRQHLHEEHAAAVGGHPKRTEAERLKEHEQRLAERAERAERQPKSEAEKQQAREERARRHEQEAEAETPGG